MYEGNFSLWMLVFLTFFFSPLSVIFHFFPIYIFLNLFLWFTMDIYNFFLQKLKLLNVNPGRNAILRGICPQVFGLFTVKLAGVVIPYLLSLNVCRHVWKFWLQAYWTCTSCMSVALTLIGGVQHVDASGTKIRGESHLLLVGDPGKVFFFVLTYY